LGHASKKKEEKKLKIKMVRMEIEKGYTRDS
jgi:hypothetical protein